MSHDDRAISADNTHAHGGLQDEHMATFFVDYLCSNRLPRYGA